MHYSAPKLHKVGEYGHGRLILAIYSGTHYHHDSFLPSIDLDHSKKLYTYFLDLNRDKKHSDLSLVETLNKFHFIKDLIVDFPTFIRIAENFKSIKVLQNGVDKLIIFNPVKPRTTIVRRLFGYDYINLNNQKVSLNKRKLHQIFQFYKNIPEISIKKLDVIALQDTKAAIKICSSFKNSRIRSFKNYSEALAEIHKVS